MNDSGNDCALLMHTDILEKYFPFYTWCALPDFPFIVSLTPINLQLKVHKENELRDR